MSSLVRAAHLGESLLRRAAPVTTAVATSAIVAAPVAGAIARRHPKSKAAQRVSKAVRVIAGVTGPLAIAGAGAVGARMARHASATSKPLATIGRFSRNTRLTGQHARDLKPGKDLLAGSLLHRKPKQLAGWGGAARPLANLSNLPGDWQAAMSLRETAEAAKKAAPPAHTALRREARLVKGSGKALAARLNIPRVGAKRAIPAPAVKPAKSSIGFAGIHQRVHEALQKLRRPAPSAGPTHFLGKKHSAERLVKNLDAIRQWKKR
jgi:hypothetical protein